MDGINRFLNNLGLSPIYLNGFELFMALVDIAIVAYALYRITAWIKETRAWALFKGLLVIIGVFIASGILKLYTIQWILQNTLNVGIIALIIIFQPEMRKALEELGKGKILSALGLSFGSSRNGEQPSDGMDERGAEEIAAACAAMSKAKTGALIVVQRGIGLMDLQNTGVAVDAKITAQLLINIFEDKTPLHDGAVIIKGDRIAAAACIMPLTAAQIGQEMGTRHRAAIGASEVSDAIVVVVSEETGVISICRNGRIARGASEKDLAAALRGDPTEKDKKGKKEKKTLWKGRVKK